MQQGGLAATGAEVAFEGEFELHVFAFVGQAGQVGGGIETDVLGQDLGHGVGHTHDPVLAKALGAARTDAA